MTNIKFNGRILKGVRKVNIWGNTKWDYKKVLLYKRIYCGRSPFRRGMVAKAKKLTRGRVV